MNAILASAKVNYELLLFLVQMSVINVQ